MAKKYALGIDVGGTYTKFGLVDKDGESLLETQIPTTGYDTIDAFCEYLRKSFDEATTSLENIEIIGVGVGAPNGNYYKGTIEYAPNLKWKGIVPFIETLKKYFEYPAVLTNDANAAAIGEMIFGGAQGMKNFIVITLGTGLGSGIVANGELVYGHDGFAGELGHTTAFYGGRMCGTGKRGCLEAYASATGIKRSAFYLMADSMEESELRKYSFNELTAKHISDAALNGDWLAREAFRMTGEILGKKLAEFVAFSSPEAIFLFGGLAKAGKLIIDPTKKYMEEHLIEIFRNKVKIQPSGCHDKNSAVLGASALAWKEFG